MKFAYLAFAAALLQSCSLMEWVTPTTEQRYANALTANQFVLADRLGQRLLNKAEEPEQQEYWQQQLILLQQQSEQFLTQEIAQINRLLGNDSWLEANQRTRFLVENSLASQTLVEFAEAYQQKQAIYIDSLERSLLLLDSRQIPDSLQVYELIYQADDENAAAYERLQQERDKRDQVFDALQRRVANAEQERDFETALVYARAMQRLQDSPDVLAKIRQIRQDLTSSYRGAQRGNKLTERQKVQLNDYGKALLNEQWMLARSTLDAMLAERPADGELLGQNTYLKEVFVEKVAQATALGEKLYSEGKIEEALMTWRAVLPLAPDDLQLAANIERAQRILDKVEALKSGVDQPDGDPQPTESLAESVDNAIEIE